MADSETTKNILPNTNEESVDDILAGIFNSDGSFNDEFNSLFMRYIGVPEHSKTPDIIKVDISDRSAEERYVRRADFDSSSASSRESKSIDKRIEEKMSDSVRDVYSETAAEAQRPAFTSNGDVRYPTMGVGDSEERVVFDADWEEEAKKEAERLQRLRQDRMLRGDSAYARTFITSGGRKVHKNPYVDNIQGIHSGYIDPLSDDDNFAEVGPYPDYSNGSKKSFFSEGFSVTQTNNAAAGGKTKNKKDKFADGRKTDQSSENNADSEALSWTRVDVTQKKRKRSKNRNRPYYSTEYSKPLPQAENAGNVQSKKKSVSSSKKKESAFVDMSQVEAAANEAMGLKTTVAEIVEKYNRRAEEEAIKKAEEEARLEQLKKEKEYLEKQKQAKLLLMRKNISRELAEALNSGGGNSEDFDDFSDKTFTEFEKNEEKEKNFSETSNATKKYIEHIDKRAKPENSPTGGKEILSDKTKEKENLTKRRSNKQSRRRKT